MDDKLIKELNNKHYKHQKKQGFININKLLHSVVQDYEDRKGNLGISVGDEDEVKRRSIEILSNMVMDKYKIGVIELFRKEFKQQEEDDVYYMIKMKCPLWFYEKYAKLIKLNGTNSYIGKLALRNSKSSFVRGSISKEIGKFISEISGEDKIELLKKIDFTLYLKNKLKNIFETNDKYEEMLINSFIDKYIQYKINLFKERFGEAYPIYCQISREKLLDSYYELNFEDFILCVFRVFRFYTRLNVKMDLSPDNHILVKIYGDRILYSPLAEFFEYELQLKPYAMKYDQFIKMFYMEKTEPNEGGHLLIINNSFEKTFQIDDLDDEEPTHFPPHMAFQLEKDLKYRRYTHNDLYHDCPEDPEFNDEANQLYKQNKDKPNYQPYSLCNSKCDMFRNIDKLRILNRAIEKTIKFSIFSEFLELIVYKRNFKAYENDLTVQNIFFNTWNIFDGKAQKRFVNMVRNFYGERMAFYFVFLRKFSLWLLFPSILGIITFISQVTANSLLNKGDIKTFSDLKINYSDFVLFSFCLLITIWATLFLKVWKQKEKQYTYIWGMESIQNNEPNQEEFKKETNMDFIFGEQIPVYPRWKRSLKSAVSYTIVTIMIIITAMLSYLIFRLKANKTNNGKDESLDWPIYCAILNGFQIRVMSVIYEYVAGKLTEWENHEKKSQKENSLAIKNVIFEFINHYIALYYIGFLKPYLDEPCIEDNCLKEIEVQLYIILLLHLIFNLMGLAIPFIKTRWRMRNLKNHQEEKQEAQTNNSRPPSLNDNSQSSNHETESISFKTHTLEHQIISEKCESLMDEYNEIVKLFGYVCFFSVAAPLTPMIIFILTCFEKHIDSYKIFYLYRITIIEGSTGIEIYNTILKVFYFIGMLTNIGLVLFTNPHLIRNIDEYKNGDITKNNDFIVKIIIFALLENFILIIMGIVDYDTLPKWFEHIDLMKALYTRKYYNRDTETLPHKTFVKADLDNSKNFLADDSQQFMNKNEENADD